MQFQVDKCDGITQLRIIGAMTLPYSYELKTVLLDTLNESTSLEINLAEVSELDVAGLQLLLLCKREAKTQGKTLHLIAHSTVVADTLEMCHLVNFFGDPLVVESTSNHKT